MTPTRDPNFRPAVLERIRQTTRETWAGYVRGHLAAWSITAQNALVQMGKLLQHLGGAVMLLIGGLVYLAGGLGLSARVLRRPPGALEATPR